MNVLSPENQIKIIASLTSGLSKRHIARDLHVHQDTVSRFGLKVGQGCARLHDQIMRNLQVPLIELDEQWDFIKKHPKHVAAEDPEDVGEIFLYVALAAVEKAVLSYMVGKRTVATTDRFVLDLRSRIVNRPQITSDGYRPYIDAVDIAFDGTVDFAQLVKKKRRKNYRRVGKAKEEPPFIQKVIVFGNPDPKKISTSFVERFNLSTRMESRRYTRRTNAHSKSLRHHVAAVSLWIAFYNFCRVHGTLKTTPAVALHVAEGPWSIGELIDRALSSLTPPDSDPPTGITAPVANTPPKLVVIRGGKSAKR